MPPSVETERGPAASITAPNSTIRPDVRRGPPASPPRCRRTPQRRYPGERSGGGGRGAARSRAASAEMRVSDTVAISGGAVRDRQDRERRAGRDPCGTGCRGVDCGRALRLQAPDASVSAASRQRQRTVDARRDSAAWAARQLAIAPSSRRAPASVSHTARRRRSVLGGDDFHQTRLLEAAQIARQRRLIEPGTRGEGRDRVVMRGRDVGEEPELREAEARIAHVLL